MAFCVRRALSSRSLFLSLRLTRCSTPHSHLSYLVSSHSTKDAPFAASRGGFSGASFDVFFSNRRGFAKGKKSKNEDDSIQVAPDMGPVKSTALSQMEAAVAALSKELAKLRTGRASAGMLDHIIVEINEVKKSLNYVAAVSVSDAQTLSVTPYDPNSLKAIERAIMSSPLGLNPKVAGEQLIVAIPPLTKEGIHALCKVVAKSAEDVKQSIRRARQKALDSIKKASSSLSKDDIKRLEKEVDDMTKRFIKSAEEMCKAKEKEMGGR